MQKWLWRALGACSTVLLVSNAAFAESSCPEGMREFVDTETQERVCIPSNVQKTPTSSNVQETPTSSNVQETPTSSNAQETPTAQQVETKPRVAENTDNAVAPASGNTAEPVVSPTAPSQDANPTVTGNDNRPAEATGNVSGPTVYSGVVEYEDSSVVVVSKSRNEIIHDSMMLSGFSFELGLGYGFLANIDIHVSGGYHFQAGDSIATFGLYLDFNLKPGGSPYFAMDMTLDPTMHISKGRFRFGLGLGLGTFISKKGWLEDLYYYDDEYNERNYNSYVVAFELKPRLSFDWFLSTQGYLGASIDIPMVISDKLDQDNDVAPMVNLDVHIGCKF